MKLIRFKFKITLIFTLCIAIFSACSNTNENTREKSISDEQTNERNNESYIEKEDLTTNSVEKIDVPNSKIAISDIEGKSLFYISDIDGSSEINREVIEVLTEFAAEDVGEGTKLTLPEDILFDYDSSELRPDAGEAIQKLVNLSEEIEEDITIVGHTDSRGEDDYNQQLSEERSEAVLNALVDSGVKNKRLTAEGRGDTEPVAHNTMSDGSDNPEGREQNRRVEIIIHGFDH